MPNYTHVQFISWEIYTGPNRGSLPWKNVDKGQSYTGLGNAGDNRTDINGQMEDIEARVAFTSKAMNAAHDLVDSKTTTLKVFMAPEFLYRGHGGAYLHDLINGWQSILPADLADTNLPAPYEGLFGRLQQLAAHQNYDNWLFVFGTAISASFPVVQDAAGKCVMDFKQKAEIFNTALVQRGGPGNTSDNYASRKHYKSSIDFIEWWLGAVIHHNGNVVPADPEDLVPVEGDAEGSATFTINEINDNKGKAIPLGLEVCLDHACSGGNRTNHWGRIRTSNRWVKLQLVPSGGMSLINASIRLLPGEGPTPHSYAFNCDGLQTPENTWGNHTQIWNGANGVDPVPSVNKLITAGTGKTLANTQVAKVVATVRAAYDTNVNDTQLWDLGSGHIRVMQPMQI